MSLRKIALLVLIVGFAATVETAWNLQGDVRFGPEGCRVMGGRFYGPSWSFEAAAEHTVAAAAPRIEVDNAFGAVTVAAGAPGVVKVRLRKVVYEPTEEKARAFAERIELRVTGDLASVRIGTNRDELGRRERVGFETHLEIEAPAVSVVAVDNEHGAVGLSGMAAAEVSSSFEAVSVERVAGDVTLDSRHGDVTVEDVGGGLTLAARHGNVSVAAVRGAAKLDVEHGDVEARRTGPLEVAVAHGSLAAATVGGDLVVRSQHGAVSADDVAGGADVEASFGGLRVERVGGELRVRSQHGAVEAKDVTGGADVEASHDDVTLERVAGPVVAAVDRGGVSGHGLARGVRIRVSHASVSLDGFAGPVEVQVDRGSVRLAPGAPIATAIAARAAHGGIELEVPEGSRFDLDAESRDGSVSAPLPGLVSTDEGRRGQRASGRLGEGGVSVTLDADGDVTLDSRPARQASDWMVAKPRALDASPAEAPASVASPRPTPTPSPRPTPPPATPAEAAPSTEQP